MNRIFVMLRYDWPLLFVLLFTNWLPDNVVFLKFRGWCCSFFLGTCGKNLRIGRNNIFYNPSKVSIGNDVYIAHNNWFCASGEINIGNEVIFGPLNTIVAAGHTKQNGSYRYGNEPSLNIKIGDGSWITSQCVVTGGTVINNGVLLAANSVTGGKELEANSTYAGSPVNKIK
ncbi:MAG: acyltransferase [Bacteroidia bacterium]|nr:acyltransferase [Bacteroidia bacterium]